MSRSKVGSSVPVRPAALGSIARRVMPRFSSAARRSGWAWSVVVDDSDPHLGVLEDVVHLRRPPSTVLIGHPHQARAVDAEEHLHQVDRVVADGADLARRVSSRGRRGGCAKRLASRSISANVVLPIAVGQRDAVGKAARCLSQDDLRWPRGRCFPGPGTPPVAARSLMNRGLISTKAHRRANDQCALRHPPFP